MAEEGWTQGLCQAAPGFPSLLINALESLGVSECPRYYNREYEHHGTLHCVGRLWCITVAILLLIIVCIECPPPQRFVR